MAEQGIPICAKCNEPIKDSSDRTVLSLHNGDFVERKSFHRKCVPTDDQG